MIDPKETRQRVRKAIQAEFLRMKNEYRGGLEKAAKEIGVDRQQMQQWAKGVPVPADVLVMAFMKWGASLRVEDEHAKKGDCRWWEFSMSGRDGGLQKSRPHPVQMSLLDALTELQEENVDIKILRKGPGRLELGVKIGFKNVKF